MASESGPLKMELREFSARLLAEQEVIPRARTIAGTVAELLPGTAINVYIFGVLDGEEVWAAKASAGEAGARANTVSAASAIFSELRNTEVPLLFSGAELSRENYSHLDIRKTFLSLAYLPFHIEDTVFGAMEIVSFQEELTEEALGELSDLAGISSAALAAAQRYEDERNDALGSISRLTQLYDLEKVFASTLEMAELLPIIGSKVQEVMECQAVNVWLLQPDESIQLTHQAGSDATVPQGSFQKPGEGIPGDVSDSGEAVLIDDPEDERLAKRNAEAEEETVRSLLVVPILDKGALVGVVEAVNKVDGTPFDDDELFALTSLAETASSALHNASLLMAERKVAILETLVTVSHEITSTLNLERMLQTIVNAPQAVIPYERAAIVLRQGGRFKLSAVTGQTQVNADAPDIAPLNEILQWASLSQEVIHVSQRDEEIDADREETRAKFKKYFAASGMRGFYAKPLNDDTGSVGLLALESTDPDFLGSAHIEILDVLSSQATVALRNAQLYKEVPFISVLEPVLVQKRKFMAMEKRRRTLILVAAAAAVLFLVACPLPLRVDGDAIVAPGSRALIQPELEGVVSNVFVHEGQSVQRGQVLAKMEDWNLRSAVAEAHSRYEAARLQMNRALAANDGTEAGVHRVQSDYWKAEVGRTEEMLEKASLRSPIDGVIATPHVENFAGRKLEQGDSFAEVVDTSQAVVDVAIDDLDAGLLKDGEPAVVKLNSYPTRTFRGDVVIVSPKAEMLHETPVFYARVAIPNPDGVIRAGMEGRGKVRVGWYPAGYVFFRRAWIWSYAKLWNWVGW
jgi:RND family efflux transporter MFP subunit